MSNDMTNEGVDFGADAGGFGADLEGGSAQTFMGDDKSADGAAVSPEIYGDFGLEEGSFDPETMNSFKGILANAGLGKETGAALGAQIASLQQEHLARVQTEMSRRWLAETRSDREFGGARLAQTQTRIAAAINAFGGPDAAEIRALFNETGIGNHPALVRFFARAGSAISEDGPINSATAAYGGKSAATLLYPSMEGK